MSCSVCQKPHRVPSALEFDPVCSTCAADGPALHLLAMDGSFPLTGAAIDAVLSQRSAGNYALGYMDDTTFIVSYVGRSDSDVRRRLHDWVGAPSQYRRYAPGGKAAWGARRGGLTPLDTPMLRRVGGAAEGCYTHFAYRYAASPEAAFQTECRNYEDFGGRGGLDNDSPPSHQAT
jgi:hypothetical protein